MVWFKSTIDAQIHKRNPVFLKLGIILMCTGKQNSWTFRRIKKLTETVMTVCTFITLPTDVTNIFHKQNGKIMDFL